MNRKFVLMAIVIGAVISGFTAYAQQHRLHNQIMKDVAPTFASLKKNLDAMDAAAAAADAAKLEGLFSEVEEFWTPLNTQDAVVFSKRARAAANAIGNAAKANDMKTATASYPTLQRTCGGCHTAHRDETTAGFSIKP